jgi:hypothetical protein
MTNSASGLVLDADRVVRIVVLLGISAAALTSSTWQKFCDG